MRWLLAVALSFTLAVCAPSPASAVWQGWLIWTNPCDADLFFRTFYAVRQGNADTLKSAPYPLSGPDEEPLLVGRFTILRAASWARSGPCQPDSCRFTVPRGTWEIWVTSTDTTGNESGESNHVTVVQP